MYFKPILLILGALASGYVFAAPNDKLNLSAGLVYENSDNITLSSADKKNENIVHTLFTAEYKKESARLKADFNLAIDKQDYRNDLFPDRTSASSNLSILSILHKNRLYWSINNKYENVQSNQALPNIPTNQENTNYFITGPELYFFQNTKHSMNVDLMYENFYTEKSGSDFRGYRVDASYLRNVRRTLALGLTVKYNDRNFDNNLVYKDYKRTDMLFNFVKIMRLSKLEFDLGRTILKYKDANDTKENSYMMLFQHQLSEVTNLNISYVRELSDYSNTFYTTSPGAATYTSVSSSIFLLKQGQLSLIRTVGLSSIQYNYLYIENDYNDNTLDSTTSTSSIVFTNKITKSVNVDVSGEYRNSKFTGIDRRDISRIFSVALKKIFRDSYDIAIGVKYTNNSSTNANFIYDERRITLGGHYYFR